MSAARYKAWRFIHPDLDQAGEASGLSVSNRGAIAMVEGAASVRQAVLLLLSTRPGERVMRPTYGCHLHRLVFSPNDDTTAGLAIHYVRQALERWEPRVDILHIDASASTNAFYPGLLEIYLEYRLRSTLHTETLVYGVDLAGDQIQ
jgi:phage baseplate assembly protein W